MGKKKKPKEKKKEKKKRMNYKILWQEKDTMVRSGKVVFSSFGGLLKRSKLNKFYLDTRIGTPDPALTGILYGGFTSISFPLQAFLPNTSINLYPDFERVTLKTNLELALKTRFFDLTWMFIRTLFLLPKRALFRFFRKLFKKEEVKDGKSSKGPN